jgi:hypothetical protein
MKDCAMPKQTHPTSLRMADGGTFMKGIKRIWSGEATASPPPAPAAPPPEKAISSYAGGTALDRRMKSAGLRDGGDLRTGHGGNVPGAGKGDKIPAKYEPGEFVVSNAMLDEAPGLRDQLHSLRNGVLAAQGKTPAEADAKALRGGSLRALDGYDPLDRMARQVTGQNPLPARSPMGNMAESLHTGVRPAPVAPPAASTFDQEVRARAQAATDVRRAPSVSAPTPAPVAPTTTPAAPGALRNGIATARGAVNSTMGKAGVLGAAAMGIKDAFGTDTETYARRFGLENTQPGVLRDVGVRALGVASDLGNNLALGLPKQFMFRDGDNAAATPPGAPPAKPPTAPTADNSFGAPQAGPNTEPGIRRVNGGSSPLFTNQSDADNASLMGRGQVSAQNMGAADALASRSQAEAQASLRDPDAGPRTFVGADTGGFGLQDKNYLRERSLRMDTTSTRSNMEDPKAYQARIQGAANGLEAFRKEQNEAPRRAADRAAETQRSLRSDDTTRRGQDLELGGRTITAQSNAATARFNATREQANKDREFSASQRRDDQTMGDTARKGLAEEMKVFGPDGKLDEGASAASVAVAQQLFPGIDRLTPEARSKVMPDVKEMAAIFNKAKDQDKVGFDALKFWEPARPSLRSMPDAKGGTTEQVSGLGGWFTAGASNGDTLLNNNGKTLNLGPLNERQRELLKRAQTNGWGQ